MRMAWDELMYGELVAFYKPRLLVARVWSSCKVKNLFITRITGTHMTSFINLGVCKPVLFQAEM